MNLKKDRTFLTKHNASVQLQGDGSFIPRLYIAEYVDAQDLREIAKQLKKWADKLEKAELGQ